MTKEERFDKINKKYGINVIAIYDGRAIYELDGYIHNIKICDISRVNLSGSYSMTTPSYIKYINNTVLSGTGLEAIDVDGDYIVYVNHSSGGFSKVFKYGININTMLSVTDKTKRYRDKIIAVHGDKYNYDNCWPETSTEKVEIGCPLHGKFYVSVSNIINRHVGCPECANELKGYSRHVFVNSCKKNNGGNGIMYLAKISNNDEAFLKVGITSYPNAEHRFNEIRKTYYNVESILEVTSSPEKIYNLEHYIHRNFSKNKYLPKLEFNGRSECYSIEVLDDLLKNICEKL